MIAKGFLMEWQEIAPWNTQAMIEQDLIISRAVVEIFSHPLLAEHLAFRGGTALHKVFLLPSARYSEDIDLVQLAGGPIGPIFDALREKLSPWLGKPQRKQGPGVVNLTYKVQSEDVPPLTLRLKIEINSREHFTALGIQKKPFAVNSRWFDGKCEISTYQLEELLGTKMRALYQRRKGRDLFDLWLGLSKGKAKPDIIVKCFRKYMEASGLKVSAKEYRMNMEAKINLPEFRSDTEYLLRAEVEYPIDEAYRIFDKEVLSVLEKKEQK
jgi:predicted nucleotidyltransferase component of viral defense system